MKNQQSRIRVDAVSYLNSVPLVWGMAHGAAAAEVDLSFSIPSVCAAKVERGEADIGLVPVAEVARQDLAIVPGVGIACLGTVRSISLYARVPWREVRRVAVDLSSRTSVQLARVILRERFGVEPQFFPHEPALQAMLDSADAALLIGDAALRVEPAETGFEYLDLGAEWLALTGLPMVFAVWAGHKRALDLDRVQRLAQSSWEFGRARLDEIVEAESQGRNMPRDLVDRYLTNHIRYELGRLELQGLESFLDLADLRTHGAHRPALAANF